MRIKGKNGFPHSEEIKRKIALANRGIWIKFNCDICKKECEEKQSHFSKSTKHFCGVKCFTEYKRTLIGNKAPQWKGGRYEAHKRWIKKYPEKMAHLKARRYARERGAEGSHTLEEWKKLCEHWGNTCCQCRKVRKLTKDHIIPLSEGGGDDIKNIQPMCRNCNSKKWKFIYENKGLLTK